MDGANFNETGTYTFAASDIVRLDVSGFGIFGPSGIAIGTLRFEPNVTQVAEPVSGTLVIIGLLPLAWFHKRIKTRPK